MTPIGDKANAGVNWTVTCGGSPVTGSVTGGACGTLVPTHTPDGVASVYTAPSIVPIGNTVTLTAAVASNPSAVSSFTLPVVAQPISISFVSPPSGVAAGGQVSLKVTVLNGAPGTVIEWTAMCGSSLCGYFAGQTQTAPSSPDFAGVATTYTAPTTMPASGNTVTITAAIEGDPASATSTNLTISAAPISINFTSPTTTLPTGGVASFRVTLAGSLASGIANLSLSCNTPGSCGSLPYAQTANGLPPVTYTAPLTVPSGGTVTITAVSTIDPTQSATAALSIVQAPTIAFSQVPPLSMPALTQAQVSAIVANDIPPGGVTWTLSCNSTAAGGCGAITHQTPSGQAATYTAPPVTANGTAVTINAASTADPGIRISSAAIAIAPATDLSIEFVSIVPSQMQPAGTVNLNAAVSNDSSNEGVDWQVCGNGCGYFTIKPATPAIPATATTPFQPAVPAVTSPSVRGWPNGLPIPYTAPITPPGGPVTITAIAHADTSKVATSSVTITDAGTGPALNGSVLAGAQPVVGALVQLLEAGSSGYGSAALALTSPGATSAVVTDSNGNFSIPAGYACAQPGSQVYVVASGGSVGANQPNSALAMMTALGSCGNLNSQTFVVNEATTAASVWPLAPFAANDALTGNSSYFYVGTSSSNLAGLSDAFATVNNLVDISTGQPRYAVPAGNAMAPYVEINTLADILNACTSTSGGQEGDGSPCGNLLKDTDVLSPILYASTPPRDTLQAAFNIAQHPAGGFDYRLDNNTGVYLFGLASAGSPFQPILTSTPSDWSLSLNYFGGGLSSSSAVNYLAVDGGDNLWMTDSNASSVIEWNNLGVPNPLSPYTGISGAGPLAVDASGNIWISGNNSLTELTNLGAPYPWSPLTGIAGGGDMAFDAGGNLWIGNGGSVAEFRNLGVELSPPTPYVNNGVTGIGPVVVDSSDNVWAGGTTLAELSGVSGQSIVNTDLSATGVLQMAADGSGRIWIPFPTLSGANAFCGVQPANTIVGYQSNCGNTQDFGEIANPQGIAVDGAGYVWIGSSGRVTEIDPGELSSDPSEGQAGYQSPSLSNGTVRVAVDRAGNVWVLVANNTVTEYVGVATPVVTPIALGVTNNKLGAKP